MRISTAGAVVTDVQCYEEGSAIQCQPPRLFEGFKRCFQVSRPLIRHTNLFLAPLEVKIPPLILATQITSSVKLFYWKWGEEYFNFTPRY